MANYEILIKRSAAKELEALPRSYRQKVARKVSGLRSNPRPQGSEKLSGEEKYRLRQGDYRIVYEVNDGARQVIDNRTPQGRLSSKEIASERNE